MKKQKKSTRERNFKKKWTKASSCVHAWLDCIFFPHVSALRLAFFCVIYKSIYSRASTYTTQFWRRPSFYLQQYSGSARIHIGVHKLQEFEDAPSVALFDRTITTAVVSHQACADDFRAFFFVRSHTSGIFSFILQRLVWDEGITVVDVVPLKIRSSRHQKYPTQRSWVSTRTLELTAAVFFI